MTNTSHGQCWKETYLSLNFLIFTKLTGIKIFNSLANIKNYIYIYIYIHHKSIDFIQFLLTT